MESEPAAVHRYSPWARRLHWAVFIAVALAYLAINLRGVFPRGSAAARIPMQAHIAFGLAVLALVLPRILQRLRHAPPAIVPATMRWEAVVSGITHLALYAFLVVQPLLGLATEWAAGPLNVPFTHWQVPSPLTPDHALHESLGHLHGTIGTVFYYVIGLHIAAAFWHHFGRRDDTLRRML